MTLRLRVRNISIYFNLRQHLQSLPFQENRSTLIMSSEPNNEDHVTSAADADIDELDKMMADIELEIETSTNPQNESTSKHKEHRKRSESKDENQEIKYNDTEPQNKRIPKSKGNPNRNLLQNQNRNRIQNDVQNTENTLNVKVRNAVTAKTTKHSTISMPSLSMK